MQHIYYITCTKGLMVQSIVMVLAVVAGAINCVGAIDCYVCRCILSSVVAVQSIVMFAAVYRCQWYFVSSVVAGAINYSGIVSGSKCNQLCWCN